jgi:hypothetical protein
VGSAHSRTTAALREVPVAVLGQAPRRVEVGPAKEGRKSSMNIVILVALAAVVVLLLAVLFRLSTLIRVGPGLRPILPALDGLRQVQEAGDRGLREELSRNRTE